MSVDGSPGASTVVGVGQYHGVFDVAFSVAALVVSAVTLGLTYRSWQVSDRRSRLPVLVFLDAPGKRWLLKNVGNGPALNIVVVKKLKHGDTTWTEPTRVSALARDQEIEMSWLVGTGFVAVLGATYQDLVGADGKGRGRTFTTTCEYNINSVQVGERIPADVLSAGVADWIRVKERTAGSQPPAATGPA